MNRKPLPTTKTTTAKDRKFLVLLLSFLILACLTAAAFFFFSGGNNLEFSVGYFQAADLPDFFCLPGDFEPQEIRDFGPFTVSDSLGRRSMVDFHFRNPAGKLLG